MAVQYRMGEEKTRPGLYQRHSNAGEKSVAGAQDGICAIPIRAKWGPLGEVVKNADGDLTRNYGDGTYGDAYTVPAAQAMFTGGATTVYTYRMGSGGTKASIDLTEGGTAIAKAVAKHVGTLVISISIQPKLGRPDLKEVNVYTGSTNVETFTFAVDTTNEVANLQEAVKSSRYIDITPIAEGVIDTINVSGGLLTGGSDPTISVSDYSNAFAALEPYYYNTIALDIDDDDSMTYSLLLQSYMTNAFQYGKQAISVVGQKVSVAFDARKANAKAFNDAFVVYIGGGYKNASGEAVDGVLNICQTAGLIASTPSSQSITHTKVTGATDLLEALTYAQYEEAIESGMLLLSMARDGSIWYDFDVNTLTSLDEDTQDEGWKKIRRTKTRLEMFDRLDRSLEPKVGNINGDSDGYGDVIQTANRVLATMADERKIEEGAKFELDPTNAASGDSAWFVIIANDLDSLEKIYLHYQFGSKS